jgi:hypothetical protein
MTSADSPLPQTVAAGPAQQPGYPELMPLEKVAYRVAKERLLRGDAVMPNTAAMLVLAIARLTGDEEGRWAVKQ